MIRRLALVAFVALAAPTIAAGVAVARTLYRRTGAAAHVGAPTPKGTPTREAVTPSVAGEDVALRVAYEHARAEALLAMHRQLAAVLRGDAHAVRVTRMQAAVAGVEAVELAARLEGLA